MMKLSFKERFYKKFFPNKYKRESELKFTKLLQSELEKTTFYKVTKAIKDEFPQYGDIFYTYGFPNSKGEIEEPKEMIVFFTPEDLKDAEEKQNIDRIVDIVYTTLISNKSDDLRTYMSSEDSEKYQPQLLSRRDLTAHQLWSLAIHTGNEPPMGI